MGKRIKILRIIGQCRTGGTETIALNYYHNLDHDAVAMDFMFYGKSLPRFSRELKVNGDSVINITDYSDNLIQSIADIRNVVKTGDYDIVHAQLNALNFFPLLGAKLGGARVRIASNHSTASLKYEFKKSLLKYIIRPSAKWLATDCAACSKHAGVWCFGKKAVEKGKVKIIHNAIDLSLFNYADEIRNQVRNKMEWNGKFVVGHVGRFTEQKNHRFIVDIFSEIHKRYSNSLLIFVGEGHLMKSIKEEVRIRGLAANVVFLGLRFDLNELMQGMDIFLFPSLYEGLGNVIIEAQAVGLRSVVSRAVPDEVKITELVDVLSLSDSASLWAKKILQYKNGYYRRNTYEDIKKAGYEIKSATKELENYYISLIGDQNHG